MKDTNDNVTELDQPRRLADAIRQVKNANADRDDVIIEMREAERMRLELLAQELQPIIAEIPEGVDLFDLAVSTGLQPRFWIDAVSHVSMGRDKRTFRFLRETRNGRVVLAETTDIKACANQVTRYLAERIVEQQRLMEGDLIDYGPARGRDAVRKGGEVTIQPAQPKNAPVDENQSRTIRETAGRGGAIAGPADTGAIDWRGIGQGILLAAAGILAGLAAAALVYWQRLGFGSGS